MTKEQAKPKGQLNTANNQKAYAAYVADLKATGEKFPCNQHGTISLEGVANKVGCTVKVLTKGSLKKQFAEDSVRIGVEPKSKPADSTLQRKAEEKSKESSTLRTDLNLKIKECEDLRAANERLAKTVRRLEMRQREDELSLHELLKTGRRFTL